MTTNSVCKKCENGFSIFNEDIEFYKKFEVPLPKQCPECRLIRRLMERNARNLYYRTCDFTGRKTLSQYHKDQPFPVYSPSAWWSDDWDGTDDSQDFDFSRPFFNQFLELKKKVPHCTLFNTEGTMQNSDFNNCTAYVKNCYLIAESDYCEDCYYSNLLKKCTNILDCSICYEDELCYECIDCSGCYNLTHSQDCLNSRDSVFLNNCISCSDCIGCINQRHKRYMIFNNPYSKEEYEKRKNEFRLDTRTGIEVLREKSLSFFLTQPHKAVIAEQNQNSIGDHLFNSKNTFFCFDSKDLEDCRYSAKLSLGVKSSMDYNSWGNASELMYQCTGVGDHCYNCKFCVLSQTNMRDCEYCYECFSCSQCFGCVGLKKIEHMKNTGEYGEFFPIEIGTFAYNESIASDVFPLKKEEALAKGYRWRDEEEKSIQQKPYKIADSIDEIQDEIINAILTCHRCKKNYRVIPQELAFYRRLRMPVPLSCPSCRHHERMMLRRPLKLWKRTCTRCGTSIQTSYSLDRPEIVYCEKCYLETVY